MRNYGEWTEERKLASGDSDVKVNDPVLEKVSDKDYPPYNLDYPDVERAEVFISALKGFESSGKIAAADDRENGHDHTSGTTPGKIAPLSANADNVRASACWSRQFQKRASGARPRSS